MLVLWLWWVFQTPAKATVPFTKEGHNIIVSVRINNGDSLKLVLDTGAELTVLDPAAARRVGISPGQKRIQIVGVGGRPTPAFLGAVNELALGEAKARKLEVALYAIPHLNQHGIAGLLGQDFLARFNLSFDNRKNRLTLSLPDADQPKTPRLPPEEQAIRAQIALVLEDPQQAFAVIKDLIQDIAKNPSIAHRERLTTARQDLETLVQRLQDWPTESMSGPQRNRRQRVLYCLPSVRRLLDDIDTWLTGLSGSDLTRSDLTRSDQSQTIDFNNHNGCL